MTYQITLHDRAEREARIKRHDDASSEFDNFYEFRGRPAKFKIVRLPIDLPIYRMENFRTFSDQAEYIAREHLPPNYFHSGQENESVQQIQHGFLSKLAARGKANSIVPIVEVLQREGQRDALLITRSGVVVNGNRRLAGMRELFQQEQSLQQQFSHVNCMLLPPDTTPTDLLEIEAVLQARPETRLDYDWVGDSQLLAAMLRIHKTPEAVAKRLNRKVAEVKTVLQAKTEADIYLKEWAKAEGEYNRVAEDGEQLFKDLPSLLSGKTASMQDVSRTIAWTLFDNPKKRDGRLYAYNVTFGKWAADVAEQLVEQLGIPLSSSDTQKDGEYDFDIGDDSEAMSYQPLIEILKGGPRKDEAVDALVEICDSILAMEKDIKSGNAALRAITAANAKLAEVDLSRAAATTYEGIARQLASVIQRATDMQNKMKTIMEKKD